MVDDIVGSHEKAKNGYGQNGYQGASSDLPGKHTVMNRDYGLKADPAYKLTTQGADFQTRNVSKDGYPPAFGMLAQPEPAKIPDQGIRRPRVQRAPGSFQR